MQQAKIHAESLPYLEPEAELGSFQGEVDHLIPILEWDYHLKQEKSNKSGESPVQTQDNSPEHS